MSQPITAKTSYSEQEVLSYCLQDHRTKRRLPAPPLLMFDRVPEIHKEEGKFNRGWILAEKNIHFNEWFFFCHFQGDPVMPGILQVDAILQLAGFFLMHSGFDGHGRALHTGKISFREQVRPHHKKVTYKLDIKKISTKPIPVVFAEGVAEVDGKLSVEVGGIMVGLFADFEYKYP